MDKNQYRMWAYALHNFPEWAFHNKEVIKGIKREMREWANRPIKPYSILCEDERHLKARATYPDSWEYTTYYGIIPDNGENLEKLKEDMRLEIHSAFDCTGKEFTDFIKVFRCPLGIGVIHKTALDI